MRVLLFATDMPPMEGTTTTGTALRSYGIAQGLRAHGHEVQISVPKTALEGFLSRVSPETLPEATQESLRELQETAFDSYNQADIVAALRPDAIICGHWPAMTLRTKPSQPLIIDLAGPHMLERHYQGSPQQGEAVLGKLAVVATADYFIASGPSQRLYFLSYLLRARVPQPESRITTITMPLDPNTPTRRDAPLNEDRDYPKFVFGGVFLPWQNPAWGLNSLVKGLDHHHRGSLKLIGGAHPSYPIDEGSYGALFKKLSAHPRVSTEPMLPYDQFTARLADAHVAIDLMSWNLERQLAVTIRSTTYLWAGIPVIYNDYADLGKLISKYDAGWCVTPEDEVQFTKVISEIYSNPELVSQKSENATRLAREQFSWDTAVEPLLNFLGSRSTSSFRENDIVNDYPESADYTLDRDHPVRQQFVCRVNGLSRVECRIATHRKTIDRPVSLKLYEIEDVPQSHKKLITSRVAEPETLRNNEWLALDIPAVPHSAGQRYEFELTTDERDQNACISPWTFKASPYPLMSLRYGDHQVEHASVCLRTVCSRITN